MNHARIEVLGTVQDGGLPHAGCLCGNCERARASTDRAEMVVSIAIIDEQSPASTVWLIDATPDINEQIYLLKNVLGTKPDRPRQIRQPDALLLTHAHMGHVNGLNQLGRESMSVRGLPVHGPPGVLNLLDNNDLMGPTVERFDLRPIHPMEEVRVSENITVQAIPVPHRDEWDAGTYAYRIQGPERSALYLPDIDSWDDWPDADKQVRSVDYAIVDACFFSLDEIGGRTDVPHPVITETLQRFSDIKGRLILTHFNHSNPVLNPDSRERRQVLDAGAELAHTGMVLDL